MHVTLEWMKKLQSKAFILLLLPTIVVNLLAVRLDPDPHHDGFILSTAISSSEGLLPYRDTFTYFGPITHWINSTILKVVDPSGYELLTLRLLNFGISLATVLVLSFCLKGKKYRSLANFLLITWLLSHPIWSSHTPLYFNYWPWPDQLNQFFLSIILWALLSFQNTKSSIVIGVLLALGIYIRINTGIITTLLVFFIILAFQKTKQFPRFKGTLISFIVANLSMLLVLAANGQLIGFIRNVILYPVQTFGGRLGNQFINLYHTGFNVFVLCLIFVFTVYYLNSSKKQSQIYLAITGFLVVLIVITGTFTEYDLVPDFFSGKLLYLHLGIAVIILKLISIIIFGLANTSPRDANLSELKVLTCALSGIISILYIGDIYHLWAIAPIVIVTSSMILYDLKLQKLFYVLASACLIFNMESIQTHFSEPREKISVSPLKGMLGLKGQGEDYREVSNMLAKLKDDDVAFYCPDGLFHTINGSFLPDNYNPFLSNYSKTPQIPKNLVFCIQDFAWISPEVLDNYVLAETQPQKSSWSNWSTSKLYWFVRK
jgi:hypothetical protein